MEMGTKLSDNDLDDRMKGIAINQCAHLVYTSGTTGPPKAVMLSHDNLTFTCRKLNEVFKMRSNGQERNVSYLPLSHVAANMMDIFVVMGIQGTTYFADKNALKGTLTTTLQEATPTLFFGVPRVWEKIQEKMLEVGKANKGLKLQIGNWAKRTGLAHNQNILNGSPVSMASDLQYRIANKIVFQVICMR